MQINGSCLEWMALGFIVASECKYEAMQWLLMRKYALLALYLHSEATMKPITIQSQQEPLICMLTQQGSLAVAQVVVSLLLSLLIYTFQV